MLNVNNDALIVTCVVPEGLLTDYMAKGGLAAIGGTTCKEDYRLSHKETVRDYGIKNKRLYIAIGD